MNSNISEIKEYIKTIFWTLFVALIVVALLVVDLRINVGKKKDTNFKIKELTNIAMSLDELYFLERQNPSDFMINLKMAFLYEVLKNSPKAEINYKKALEKSNNNAFAIYKAAMFYVSQKQYTTAISLMTLLPNYQDERLYELRARFYSRLARGFLDDGDYVNSVKVYKIALKYAQNTNKDVENEARKDFAKAYNVYAEKFINENDPKHAIQMLLNALDVYPDPYAMYKLGLIYQNVDDVKAQRYIEDTYKIAPEIVNADLYNNLLEKLVKRYKEEGEYSKARFYTLKLDNFKRKVVNTNIFKGDLNVSDFKIVTKKKFIIGKKYYYAVFDIKNNTPFPVDNMFVKIIMHPKGSATFESEAKVFTRNNPLAANKTSHDVKIPLNCSTFDIFSRYAEIQILARKTIRSPWVMIDYLTVSFTK